MASDQASWFCPVGVSYSAVACGVTEPEDDEDEDVADAVGRGRAGAIGELVSLGRRTGPAMGRALTVDLVSGLAVIGLLVLGALVSGAAATVLPMAVTAALELAVAVG